MKRRVMARPVQPAGRSRGLQGGMTVAILALVVAGLLGVSGMLRGGASATPGSSSVAVLPTNSSSAVSLVATAQPSRAANPASPGPPSSGPTEPPSTASPTVQPTATPGSGGAPTSPAGFDLEGQRIDIAFPLRSDTRYQYRDNFLDPRDGPPDEYNHARITEKSGPMRLHDGIDIYAAQGQPLLAPFSGTVVDARALWQPWEPDRYGNTIVIVSDEPTSEGYVALLAHADEVWVDPGTSVTRGQVVGTVGRTGNAETEGARAHLHFELRAPFLLDWSPLGEDRAIDAFNPYPSLVAADPKRT